MIYKVKKTNKETTTKSHEIPDLLELAPFSDDFSSPLLQFRFSLNTLQSFSQSMATNKNTYAPVLIYRNLLGTITGTTSYGNLFWKSFLSPGTMGFFFSELPIFISLVKRILIFPSAFDLISYQQLYDISDIHTFMIAPHPNQDCISLLETIKYFPNAQFISKFSNQTTAGIMINMRIALTLLSQAYKITTNEHLNYTIQSGDECYPIDKKGLQGIMAKFNKKKQPFTIKGPRKNHSNFFKILNRNG